MEPHLPNSVLIYGGDPNEAPRQASFSHSMPPLRELSVGLAGLLVGIIFGWLGTWCSFFSLIYIICGVVSLAVSFHQFYYLRYLYVYGISKLATISGFCQAYDGEGGSTEHVVWNYSVDVGYTADAEMIRRESLVRKFPEKPEIGDTFWVLVDPITKKKAYFWNYFDENGNYCGPYSL